MIETNFYVLTEEQYHIFCAESQKLGVSIDYFLDEWCEVEGPYITSASK